MGAADLLGLSLGLCWLVTAPLAPLWFARTRRHAVPPVPGCRSDER